MRNMRNYEQKKALVSKWFTCEEIKEYLEVSNKPVLAKVDDYSSSNLGTVINSCLPEIADEKEKILETITECLNAIDSNSLLSLLDMFQSKLYSDLTENGRVEDIDLSEVQIHELLDSAYTTFEIVKALTKIIDSQDRIDFFERRLKLAKAGVSE